MHNTPTRRFVFVLLLLALATGVATAQLSAGLILGEPTGLSGKMWLGDNASVDVALAWSFTGGGQIYIHGDYQQHFDVIDVPEGRLPFFVGIGPKIYVGQEFVLGARIPLGLVYEFQDIPLEVFLEVAPGLLLFPETRFDGGGGIGIRYRF